MEFELPTKSGFSIYSKSGCPNCSKVKSFLKDNNYDFNVIDCDEYLIEAKDEFLEFIKNLAQKECRVFPIIFFNGNFVGGFNETKELVDKLSITFE
jgi:glutaredoxin